MNRLFNPAQRRSVTTTLRDFEISLRRALLWLEGQHTNGILYHDALNLSDLQRARIRQTIEVALEEIDALCDLLRLNSEEQEAGSLIRSEMTIAWANLLDIQSKKLRRYGAVDPQVAEVLDPRVRNLSNLAIQLAKLFEDANASGETHEQY